MFKIQFLGGSSRCNESTWMDLNCDKYATREAAEFSVKCLEESSDWLSSSREYRVIPI